MKNRKKVKSMLVDILEQDFCFRDYRILPSRYYRKVKANGLHFLCSPALRSGKRLSDAESMRAELNIAITDFHDTGDQIIFYI